MESEFSRASRRQLSHQPATGVGPPRGMAGNRRELDHRGSEVRHIRLSERSECRGAGSPSEGAVSGISNGQPRANHPSTPSNRMPTSPALSPKQDTGGRCSAIAFVAVDQTGLGRINDSFFRIEVEQRQRGGTRQVSFQPFGPAAHIDELHGRILLQGLANIRTPAYRNAGKIYATAPRRLANTRSHCQGRLGSIGCELPRRPEHYRPPKRVSG